MSRFEKFWETMTNRFPSDTSRYFAKPLLKEAYQQGYADRKAETAKKVHKTGDVSFEVVASGMTGEQGAKQFRHLKIKPSTVYARTNALMRAKT